MGKVVQLVLAWCCMCWRDGTNGWEVVLFENEGKHKKSVWKHVFCSFSSPREKENRTWQKLTILNATTAKFNAELRFGSQILPKSICSNSHCCQWPSSHRFGNRKLLSILSPPAYSTLLYLHTNLLHFRSFDEVTSPTSSHWRQDRILHWYAVYTITSHTSGG